MALISYNISFTLHLGAPSNNEYIKVGVEVKDVDTTLDAAEQIQACHNTFHEVAQWAEAQMDTKVMEALGKK